MTTDASTPVARETMDAFADFGVATVYEAAGRAGLLNLLLIQLLPGSSVCGPARIDACEQGDNRAVHEIMAHVRAGDVLV